MTGVAALELDAALMQRALSLAGNMNVSSSTCTPPIAVTWTL
jgi:hypothetical protein